MPHQQLIADVIGEVDPDTGQLVYNEWGLTIPRQEGKSTFVKAKATHRASATGFFGPRQHIVYTAQTRNKARKKWEEDFVADIVRSTSFGGRVKASLANGNEHLRFPNGSRFGVDSNTEKSGHGDVLDEAFIDEAFAQIDNRLEQAFRPAMITRRNKQLGWISTAGWKNASPYLEAKVKRGREAVEADLRTGLAYFEWSADEGADPEDRDQWRKCMPALGYTITEAAIQAELEAMADNLNDFRRAYLNLWVPKETGSLTVLDMDLWAGLADPEPPKCPTVGLAIDVTPDRSSGSVAFAGARPDGKRHVEIIDNKRGTEWIVPLVAQAAAERPGTVVVLDASGPASSLLPDLVAAGVEVVATNARDMAQACGDFYDAVNQRKLSHFDQPALNAALGAARKRPIGDQFGWNRKDETDISPLVACSLALHALKRTPPKKRTGKVW